ncbi:MAG: serine/threonine-protein kinase [Candidatus Anstonellales archaeon]
MKPEEIGIGSEIGGFKIEEVLGRGGMGVVYKAHELSLNRKVALKVLSQKLSSDQEFIQRFKREAQIIASLDHPNIVRVLAYGEEKGLYYFAMEYIKGKDLSQIFKEKPNISLEEALQITAQIANALIEAEAKGVVHRDLKPTNIMIDDKGRVKITDFGVAHLQETDVKLTRTGWFLGTPEFASPEQARGESLDIRSDIYSLGVILYWMLTGKPPISGDSPQAVLIKIATEPLPPIQKINPSIPESICRLIERMTAKDLNQRFQNAKELSNAIDECIQKNKKEPDRRETELFLEKKGRTASRISPRVWGTILGIALTVFLIVWLGEATFLKKKSSIEEKKIPESVKVEENQIQTPEGKPSSLGLTPQEVIQPSLEKQSLPSPKLERPKQSIASPPMESEKITAIPKIPIVRENPNVLVLVSGSEGMVHLLRAHLESIILQSGLKVMVANEVPKLREKIQVGEIPITYSTIKEYIPRDKADVLLLAQIQKIGSTTLQYYGRTQEMTTVSFSIQVLDAISGISITSPCTGSAQFTSLNMEENLKEAIYAATSGLHEGIKRYWDTKRTVPKKGT